jgi:hypothetical protein
MQQRFFAGAGERVGGGLRADVIAIARHMAQHDRQPPTSFPFEAREHHNLDAIARQFYGQDLGPRQADDALRGEYNRPYRFWRVIYYTYELFQSHYDACINRILQADRQGLDAQQSRLLFTTPEPIPAHEPSETEKAQVKTYDRGSSVELLKRCYTKRPSPSTCTTSPGT